MKRAPVARPLASVIAVVTAGALPAFLVGAVSVQLRRDLHFGVGALGVAVGAFFLAAAAASAGFGRAAERLGPTLSMRTSAAVSGVALAGVAVAARSYGSLLAWLVLGGLANALAQPAANLFIARTVSGDRMGLALAAKQGAVPASVLLGGLAVPSIALTVGWRWAFVAAAVLAAAGGLSVPSTAGPSPGRRGARPEGDASLVPLAVLGLGVGLGAAAAGSLGAFLVGAAVHAGMGEGAAGLLVAGGSAVNIAARLGAGHRADLREGGHLRVAAAMLALGALAYAAFAVGSVPLMVAATPLAFGAGWGWPGLFNLAVVRAAPGAPGAASGITQTGTYLGAVVGPLVFGALVERRSYSVAWLGAAALALAAAGAVLVGRALVRRERDGRRADPDAARGAGRLRPGGDGP